MLRALGCRGGGILYRGAGHRKMCTRDAELAIEKVRPVDNEINGILSNTKLMLLPLSKLPMAVIESVENDRFRPQPKLGYVRAEQWTGSDWCQY